MLPTRDSTWIPTHPSADDAGREEESLGATERTYKPAERTDHAAAHDYHTGGTGLTVEQPIEHNTAEREITIKTVVRNAGTVAVPTEKGPPNDRC